MGHLGIELAERADQLCHPLVADCVAPAGLKVSQDRLGQPDALPARAGEHDQLSPAVSAVRQGMPVR
jgi:hypothetical protein